MKRSGSIRRTFSPIRSNTDRIGSDPEIVCSADSGLDRISKWKINDVLDGILKYWKLCTLIFYYAFISYKHNTHLHIYKTKFHWPLGYYLPTYIPTHLGMVDIRFKTGLKFAKSTFSCDICFCFFSIQQNQGHTRWLKYLCCVNRCGAGNNAVEEWLTGKFSPS